MKTFAQVLEETEGSHRHLLIGNGFSQAWRYDIFNYKNLLDSANFGVRNTEIKSIFNRLETYDFENVMQSLIVSADICELYSGGTALLTAIRNDADILKSSLVTAIAETHPSLPSAVTDEQYEMARNFLSQFGSIFTLNYDLLMYWARNKSELDPAGFESDDGFRQHRTWVGSDTSQNVFFLHGGLHLYDEGGVIKKHAYTQSGDTIIDQVRANLASNKFPIFVSEPTHFQKLDKILHNPYLNYCYGKLGKMNGNLIIFGHSMDDTDTHIFEQVDSSGVTDVYVSIYGDDNSAQNRRTKSNAASFFETCNVHFYRAESTPIWE
ncbi:DUF4917 family protein [Vibrio cyclitrophicus]|uniref:DUF4917 family protein n=1 Tax=Vibrio TaxID=662 RepID=UPI0002F7F955|nr:MULTISPECIES: DUF4917 family protein [Vibrio]OEF20696.1 DUF4917 domain-containing protein [Vibrio splendidus 5S-101]PMK22958.1 DUF4917 domain-containing protein [Vibrio cyclitrophicus]